MMYNKLVTKNKTKQINFFKEDSKNEGFKRAFSKRKNRKQRGI